MCSIFSHNFLLSRENNYLTVANNVLKHYHLVCLALLTYALLSHLQSQLYEVKGA